MTANPFFEIWATPFGVPPFGRIRAEHFPPAFDRGMAEHLREVEAIAGSNEAPGFANTLEALERSGRLLDRARSVFFNLALSQASDAYQAVERDYAPLLARHAAAVALHPGVFQRIAVVHGRRSELGLAPDQLRLLERRHTELVRSGAALDAPARARMAALSERLAVLHTEFGQNVLRDEDEWRLVLAEADLDGLPAFARDAAREAARERGIQDGFAVTLGRSSIEPFLAFSARRDLRERAWKAWIGRGDVSGARDNKPLLREILALRAERAKLLGYQTFAAYRLADSMAREPAAAERLLRSVWAPATRKAEAERAELEAQARADGEPGRLEAWDWRYRAERARQAQHDLDEAEVKPYFALGNMLAAAFDAAGRLFGVAFAERPDIPVYHPDVRAFEVLGGGGRHVGVFLLDNFARPGKRSGAWMSSFRVAETMDGPVPPIVVNNSNVAKSSPALLSFDEAETLFHEFGHALHGLLSKVRYPSLSGTVVRKDFVEFPSQILEHWLSVPEILRTHARHHATGAPMPEPLLERLLASRRSGEGFATVEFVSSALIDLALHAHPEPASIDPAAFERAFLKEIGMPDAIGLRHRLPHFQHLFAGGGYAAGYYAYLWAEVLDADGFDAFEEAGDPFHPALAGRLKAIYEAGDTRDPMELYVAFRGRAPTADALLRNRRLLEA
jgi:peptidyl-dipeptidase Dcp